MFYEYNNELPDTIKYWSNAVADLNYVDNEDELPKELQRVLNKLWTDMYGVCCYLIEFNGKYGVALEAEYNNDYADDMGVSYDTLCDYAHSFAKVVSESYAKFDVVYGKDAVHWSNGKSDTIVTLIMPWDVRCDTFKDVAEWFDDTCYV